MDLEALFLAAREGLPGQRDRLVNEVYARLRRYFSIRFPAEDTKDLVQNAMMAVMLKFDGPAPERSFGGWLHGVARNVSRREYEERDRRARLAEAVEHAARKSQTGPSSALLWAERYEIVLEEIQQLPEGMRVVVEHDLVDGDPVELATEEGIEPGTVRTRRSRATAELTRVVLERCEAAAVSKLTVSTPSQHS